MLQYHIASHPQIPTCSHAAEVISNSLNLYCMPKDIFVLKMKMTRRYEISERWSNLHPLQICTRYWHIILNNKDLSLDITVLSKYTEWQIIEGSTNKVSFMLGSAYSWKLLARPFVIGEIIIVSGTHTKRCSRQVLEIKGSLHLYVAKIKYDRKYFKHIFFIGSLNRHTKINLNLPFREDQTKCDSSCMSWKNSKVDPVVDLWYTQRKCLAWTSFPWWSGLHHFESFVLESQKVRHCNTCRLKYLYNEALSQQTWKVSVNELT